MPWKLGQPDEPTERFEFRLPASLKQWLDEQRDKPSELVRKLLERERRRRAKIAIKSPR